MKKKMMLLFVLVLFLLALPACGGGKTIDLEKYVTVGFSGMDGDGSLYLRVDGLQLEADMMAIMGNDKYWQAASLASGSEMSVTPTADGSVSYSPDFRYRGEIYLDYNEMIHKEVYGGYFNSFIIEEVALP